MPSQGGVPPPMTHPQPGAYPQAVTQPTQVLLLTLTVITVYGTTV